MNGMNGGPSAPLHSFFVHGIPQPQGSARAFVRNGKPIITTTNKNLHDWRRLIADAAQEHAQLHTQAVMIRATFLLPKPKSAPKTKPIFCTKRPDIDKLLRALLDSFTGVFYKDDSQVVHVDVQKSYGEERVGVFVEIWAEPEPVPRAPKSLNVSEAYL